ncbi:aldolase [Paenibacillus thiaminolyticus]|uniref:aldolase n=1 Tax=Paenibacillus thiaminolyticus TaxID=49283 RepID=UPI00235001EC|nr:aldolase [Paenibacillus thiaminolyticus]WCR25476.1 aldolase [Paenibacillus thiaminolyticus]
MTERAAVRTDHYKAFGFRIESDFVLPELPLAGEREPLDNITVRRTDLQPLWNSSIHFYGNFAILDHGRTVMFRVPGAAIYAVQDASSILVSPFDQAEENWVRLFILGTCMGILLLQRKIMPLHGSAVAIDGKAYAIIGASGAGKSTLALHLVSEGYPLLSDDVIPVVMTQGSPWVVPSYPQQKLWVDTLKHMGMDNANYTPLYERKTKFAVPVGSNFHEEPLPLASIFELVPSDAATHIAPIQGMERFRVLFHHTYRNLLVQPLGLMEWHFKTLSSFIRQVGMYRLHRPMVGFSTLDLTSHIFNITRQGENDQ